MKRLIALVIAVIIFTGGYSLLHRQPVFMDQSNFTADINTIRAGYDLEPVRDDPTLIYVAEAKCSDMVERNYTGHQDPEGDYVWKGLEPNHKYGENLAGGYLSSYETVRHWVASPEHLSNIVDPVFTKVGHATCYNGKQYLNVEVFAGN